jgi:hypothetical protein
VKWKECGNDWPWHILKYIIFWILSALIEENHGTSFNAA